MSLNINSEVFITCALTGSGSTQEKSKFVPRSPKEIADDAILAAKSGASIVHCHVKHDTIGKPTGIIVIFQYVCITMYGVKIFVKSSKTDQSGEGMTKGIHYFSKSEYCPVVSLRNWLEKIQLNLWLLN